MSSQLEDKYLEEQSNFLTGKIWKLGCNWGSHKPSFYDFVKHEKIVIGVEDKKYKIGDLILVTEGHQVKSIARIKEEPKPVTSHSKFSESFYKYKIDYETWVNFAPVEWYELIKEEQFLYKLQQGIRNVNQPKVKAKALKYWNERNCNFWIFQGNPSIYDFELAFKQNLLNDWNVSAHRNKIKKGDKAIIWIVGKNAGCYALANIISKPENKSDSQDDDLWKSEHLNEIKVNIEIYKNISSYPLLWEKIKSTQGLENLKVGLQGTNFSASRKEFRIIENLTEEMRQNNPEISNNNSFPKNQILYGPPGTGKTYRTIDLAVEIAGGMSFDDHAENKKEFDRLRKEGQIEFVTFHQNYAYEDFMVGIAPDTESGQLRFDKKEGIFKKMADRAAQNWQHSTQENKREAGFEEVFSSFFGQLIEEEIKEIEIPMKSKNYHFKITYVDVDKGRIKFTKQSGGTGHDLLVKNIKGIYDGTLDYAVEGLGVYYFPLVEKLKEHAKSLMKNEPKPPLKNHVLIIDEINRANTSRVFGELITLIEDDKRLGGENELKVTLPNGEKGFGVPPNLYIVGTMNTADKSIALVDIALRRRFEFVGFYPKYEGYDSVAVSLLKRVNDFIFEKKKSADYLIGHAYFMTGNNIEEILHKKIIPLLMEYFSGNMDMVSRAFEGTGWKVVFSSETYSWEITKK